MLESAWLFVGVIGILATALALLTSDDGLAIVGGVLGFVAWAIWSYGALEVVAVGDTPTDPFTMPSVTMLGVALALIPGYIALTGPVEIVTRAQDAKVDDL